MISYRPCGACRALVPADTGCPHWHVVTRIMRADRREAKAREEKARENAREAVADFRRAMGET